MGSKHSVLIHRRLVQTDLYLVTLRSFMTSKRRSTCFLMNSFNRTWILQNPAEWERRFCPWTHFEQADTVGSRNFTWLCFQGALQWRAAAFYLKSNVKKLSMQMTPTLFIVVFTRPVKKFSASRGYGGPLNWCHNQGKKVSKSYSVKHFLCRSKGSNPMLSLRGINWVHTCSIHRLLGPN